MRPIQKKTEPARLKKVEEKPPVSLPRTVSTQSNTDLSKRWVELINQTLNLSPRCRELAAQCIPNKWEENTISLLLNNQFIEFLGAATQKELTSTLENHLKTGVQLDFKPANFTEQQLRATPAAHQKQILLTQKQQLITQLEQDAFVQALKQTFNAVIDENSVRLMIEKET